MHPRLDACIFGVASIPFLNLPIVTTECCCIRTIIFGALLQLVHHWKEIIHVHPGIMQAMPLFGVWRPGLS